MCHINVPVREIFICAAASREVREDIYYSTRVRLLMWVYEGVSNTGATYTIILYHPEPGDCTEVQLQHKPIHQ